MSTVQSVYIHMEGGSWSSNISQIRGYENLLGSLEKASALFYGKVVKAGESSREHRYRNALFHLLASQTSCYRCRGAGSVDGLRPRDLSTRGADPAP